jgi:GT2 family glycosyltransferase
VELSFCVVNTNGGPLLARCLDSIERTAPADVDYEVLVLDNASDDGSAEAARGRRGVRLIELERRTGKAANDSTLLQAASGRFCLLLNEDAELLDGAVEALLGALRRDTGAVRLAAAFHRNCSGRSRVPTSDRYGPERREFGARSRLAPVERTPRPP